MCTHVQRVQRVYTAIFSSRFDFLLSEIITFLKYSPKIEQFDALTNLCDLLLLKATLHHQIVCDWLKTTYVLPLDRRKFWV